MSTQYYSHIISRPHREAIANRIGIGVSCLIGLIGFGCIAVALKQLSMAFGG